ncbi:MAG: carbonate dehydratase [Betaproteobacteria bacterium]|nr:carbonate dehydratase [Betaproteobacteria bacterium]
MSRELSELFDRNRQWAASTEARSPGFFTGLLSQQSPRYMWLGCADSRVPANELVDLLPGELFVHRNVANLLVHSDLNALSVIQYAVDVLGVQHIIVVGHSKCGGVRAALDNHRSGLVDNWLRHVQDVRDTHEAFLSGLPDELRIDALVELNVLEQSRNVCRTTIVRDAWQRGQSVAVHGWVYGLHDGLLRDMAITASAHEEVADAYDVALASLRQRWRQAVRQRASRTTSTEASGSTSPISSTVSSRAPSSL